MTIKFHYLVRGIICIGDNFLLAHQIGADNTFLPGGHIGESEKAEHGLIREIEEEIGKMAIIKRFVGAVEHVWPAAGVDNHEINLLFEVDVPGLDPASSGCSDGLFHVEACSIPSTGCGSEEAKIRSCLIGRRNSYYVPGISHQSLD